MTEDDGRYARAIVESAALVVRQVEARALMVYQEAVPDLEHLQECVPPPTELILLMHNVADGPVDHHQRIRRLQVPEFRLTRMDQIKMATLMAFSQRMLDSGDTVVALSGMAGKAIDTMVVMKVGQEY